MHSSWARIRLLLLVWLRQQLRWGGEIIFRTAYKILSQILLFECSAGAGVVSGMESEHDNKHEDRRFYLTNIFIDLFIELFFKLELQVLCCSWYLLPWLPLLSIHQWLWWPHGLHSAGWLHHIRLIKHSIVEDDHWSLRCGGWTQQQCWGQEVEDAALQDCLMLMIQILKYFWLS